MAGELDDTNKAARESTAAKRTEAAEIRSTTVALRAMRDEMVNTKRTLGEAGGYGQALRGGVASVLGSGIQAGLGQAGGGMVDALGGVAKGLQQLLPTLGAAAGFAAAGPLGAAAGGLAGTAGSAAIERTVGPGLRAREGAIGEVTGLTAGRAAAGMALPPEALAAMLEGAMIRQRRVVDNEAAVRSASNSMSSLQHMFGSAR